MSRKKIAKLELDSVRFYDAVEKLTDHLVSLEHRVDKLESIETRTVTKLKGIEERLEKMELKDIKERLEGVTKVAEPTVAEFRDRQEAFENQVISDSAKFTDEFSNKLKYYEKRIKALETASADHFVESKRIVSKAVAGTNESIEALVKSNWELRDRIGKLEEAREYAVYVGDKYLDLSTTVGFIKSSMDTNHAFLKNRIDSLLTSVSGLDESYTALKNNHLDSVGRQTESADHLMELGIRINDIESRMESYETTPMPAEVTTEETSNFEKYLTNLEKTVADLKQVGNRHEKCLTMDNDRIELLLKRNHNLEDQVAMLQEQVAALLKIK